MCQHSLSWGVYTMSSWSGSSGLHLLSSFCLGGNFHWKHQSWDTFLKLRDFSLVLTTILYVYYSHCVVFTAAVVEQCFWRNKTVHDCGQIMLTGTIRITMSIWRYVGATRQSMKLWWKMKHNHLILQWLQKDRLSGFLWVLLPLFCSLSIWDNCCVHIFKIRLG